MSLSMGIVGLPNVGKSTLFNALTREQNAESANYPFCTIEPNKAIVPVPDARLDALAKLVNPKKVVAATVTFVDIAGLVKGAAQGAGRGNQFLGNIKEADAILHVARCFDDDDIVHVDNSVDPVRDIEVTELELLLHDLASLEKSMTRLQKAARGDKKMQCVVDAAEALKLQFEAERPASLFTERDTLVSEWFQEMRFLTDKRVVYCVNVDEAGLVEDNHHVKAVRAYAAQTKRDVVKISARMEEDMAGLSDAERSEFLESYGVSESGLDQVSHTAYHTLGLYSYFTAGPKEVRAWTIHQGDKAPQAAGVIHTDFERGFIRAEVIAFADYIKHGGEAGAKTAGVMRTEGKDYIVHDGDVMHFLFNV